METNQKFKRIYDEMTNSGNYIDIIDIVVCKGKNSWYARTIGGNFYECNWGYTRERVIEELSRRIQIHFEWQAVDKVIEEHYATWLNNFQKQNIKEQ